MLFDILIFYYGVWKILNRKKKKIAMTIVKKSPKLMVRPMLLSYIDYLVDGIHVFKNTYQIYETLVGKWIERESRKRKHQTSERKIFKQDLREYSQLVAVEIYRQRTQVSMFHLSREAAVEISCKNSLNHLF